MMNDQNDGTILGKDDFFEKEICGRHETWELIVFKWLSPKQNTHLVKDVVQEFYAKLWINWDKINFEDVQQLMPFLVKVLKNVFTDYCRKRMVKMPNDELTLALNIPGPAENADDQELLKECQLFIETLTSLDRNIMELWVYEDNSYKEISEKLDMPIGTVSSRIHRIRKQLFEKFRA